MHFEPGDLVIFYGRDFSSRVIEWATRGPSHVGIVCPHEVENDATESRNRKRDARPDAGGFATLPPKGGPANMLLFESTTLCDEPCVLTGKRTSGVQAHEPVSRIASYPGDVAFLRLMPAWRLHSREVVLLHDWLMRVACEPYDLRGALVSGTRLFKWTALMPYPDLESLFCSELCAAALMRLHRLPLSNPSLYNPASLVREVRRCGTYGPPRSLKRFEECLS
jgi:hypothetical protein